MRRDWQFSVFHSVTWSTEVFESDMTNQFFDIETIKAYEILTGSFTGQKKIILLR
jgi:hypothetical protein